MSHTDQNGSEFFKRIKLCKWVTLYKHELHWSKLSHLEVWVTMSKMGHIWPNGSEMGEWVTLYKHGSHSSKLLHLELWVTLGKMGLFWPNGSNLGEWVTLYKHGSHSSKIVALGTVSHSGQNGSLLAKWVKFGRMRHSLETCVALIKIVPI